MNDFTVSNVGLYENTDPHWRNVVFLLKPTIGAGSTVFVENSMYGTAVNRVGDVYKAADNMFPPDGYYTYFDGSGDRLYMTDSRLALGLRDFTIEFWIMLLSGGSAYGRILQIGPNSTLGSLFIIRFSSSPGYLIQLGTAGSYESVFSHASAFPENRWVHFAFVREESNMHKWRAYVNGVLSTTATSLAARNLTASALTLGANTANSEFFKGYLAEVRITAGVARYNSTFVPPRFNPTM